MIERLLSGPLAPAIVPLGLLLLLVLAWKFLTSLFKVVIFGALLVGVAFWLWRAGVIAL